MCAVLASENYAKNHDYYANRNQQSANSYSVSKKWTTSINNPIALNIRIKPVTVSAKPTTGKKPVIIDIQNTNS
jgi:hypothetical protein